LRPVRLELGPDFLEKIRTLRRRGDDRHGAGWRLAGYYQTSRVLKHEHHPSEHLLQELETDWDVTVPTGGATIDMELKMEAEMDIIGRADASNPQAPLSRYD